MMSLRRKRGHGITLLMPFRANEGDTRFRAFDWLLRYYKHHLPSAEIIVGTDFNTPFSKTTAFNNARAEAHGDILVLIDADCYIDPKVILHCAKEIRRERRRGYRLWYIPYRKFYRLTEVASDRVLDSNPTRPHRFPVPPDKDDVENPFAASHGHWWGALIQIMPAEAYDIVGGCDPRFLGWGGEDVAFMRAVDTLYCKHKTTRNQVLHLWHPIVKTEWNLRMWEGQSSARDNDALANRYYAAFGDPKRMRNLVGEYHVED